MPASACMPYRRAWGEIVTNQQGLQPIVYFVPIGHMQHTAETLIFFIDN